MPKYSDRPCARCGKMMLHAYCSQRYCKACAPLVRSDDAIISRAKQRSKRAMRGDADERKQTCRQCVAVALPAGFAGGTLPAGAH